MIKKKRGPYKKFTSSDIEYNIKYLEIKDEDNKYWKYSLTL